MSLLSPASVLEPTIASASSLTESIEDKINRIAEVNGISTTTLYNLSFSESSLGEKRVGDSGDSCGIIHHMRQFYPEQFERCEDDEFILTFASQQIAKGNESIYVPCNCYAFAKVLVDYKLPPMREIVPNSIVPRVGGLVILYYGKVKHIAVIQEVSEIGIRIREANYEPCALGERTLTWSQLVKAGYWHPID